MAAYVAQREAAFRIELGDLGEVELGTGERVAQGVMGGCGHEPVPLPGPPQPERAGNQGLTAARQQPALEIERAHHPEPRRLLADRTVGNAQERRVERRMVGEQHAPLERLSQLGQGLDEGYPPCQVVVGQPVDGDRIPRPTTLAEDQSTRAGEVDPAAVHWHSSHRQHPIPTGNEPGGLQVDGQQTQVRERGAVVGTHEVMLTG